NHVWSYDFVEDRTHDGRRYRMLNVLDEFTHECLAIRVARKLKAIDVIDVLSDLFILQGIPALSWNAPSSSIPSNRPHCAKGGCPGVGTSFRVILPQLGRVRRSAPRTASQQPMPSSWRTPLSAGYRRSHHGMRPHPQMMRLQGLRLPARR